MNKWFSASRSQTQSQSSSPPAIPAAPDHELLRAQLRDEKMRLIYLGILGLIFATASFVAFEFDIDVSAVSVRSHDEVIDLGEVSVLGLMLLVGAWFLYRHYNLQRQQMYLRIEAAEQLRESEWRFRTLLQNVELGSLMLDPQGRVMYCNPTYLRLTGWTLDEIVGKDWFAISQPPGNRDMRAIFQGMLTGQLRHMHGETEIITRSGERRAIYWSNALLRSASGEVIGMASIGNDITERKLQERRIARLNRTQKMLSGINQLIVRQRHRQELFGEVCRIVTDSGAFRFAWIGMLEPDGLLKPVASAGHDDGYLERVNALLLTSRKGNMANTALTTGQVSICNDVETEPHRLSSSELALQRGYRAVAVFPLKINQQPVGCLCLFSAETGVFDDEEVSLLDELVNDVSYALEFIARDERLDYLNSYDPVTGLANRAVFTERVDKVLSVASKDGAALAVAVVDIARFKSINDVVFKSGGNQVLKLVGERLARMVGSSHLVARIEGDRFMLLITGVDHPAQLQMEFDEHFWPLWDQPVEVMGLELRIAVRLGLAIFHPASDPANADLLLSQAELALKSAKAGGEQLQFYSPGAHEASAERLTFEWRVRRAVESAEFRLQYQPKIDLRTGQICGAEALLRWTAHDLGPVSPARFVPVLEETGLILKVGRWALTQAAEDHQRWIALGLPPVRVAVNVSPLQLRQADFVDSVKQAVQKAGAQPAAIELEVTESMLMTEVEQTIRKLEHLRELGISASIDDFGTGYSSLAYLARLPVTTIKIDRSFVIKMNQSPETMAVVSSILSLAESLKLKVVAEGVETAEQLHSLQRLRCQEIQGYVFSPAIAADAFAQLLRSERRLDLVRRAPEPRTAEPIAHS